MEAVPDDGGQPYPFNISGTTPMREMSEYTHEIMRGKGLTMAR
jgi:hypothetical protein